MKFKILTLCLIAFLSGCAINSPAPTTSIDLTFPEQNRIRFSGKGSGAGMMLMSSMGPMGIAVGVAIDEGIGKDIEKAAHEGDVHFDIKIRGAVENWALQFQSNTVYVDIERYGFLTQPGANDPVTCELKLKYSTDEQHWTSIDYPTRFEDFPTRPLDDIKTDALAIDKLIDDCLRVAFKEM